MIGRLIVEEVESSLSNEEFIRLPRELYRKEPFWVPPFLRDERNFHDPGRNPMLSKCTTVLFIARLDEKAVGRIMGIIHEEHNRKHDERTARFFKMECTDDHEVAALLLEAVENWARSHGMNRVIGPFGFSDKDPQGLQIEGFDHLPVIAAPANPKYLPGLITAAGYVKYLDCVSYLLDIPPIVPARMKVVAERARRGTNIRLLSFQSRRDLKPWIVPVLRLVNATYKGIFGFMPLSEEEMYALARQYLPVLDPEFTKLIVDAGDRPVAFVIAMPDISRGIQRAGGKLFPLGFLYILSEQRKSRRLVTLLGAVKEGWEGRGLTAWLGEELLESAKSRGMKDIDSHLILEQNVRMRGVMEKFGGRLYKRFRIYQKNI